MQLTTGLIIFNSLIYMRSKSRDMSADDVRRRFFWTSVIIYFLEMGIVKIMF